MVTVYLTGYPVRIPDEFRFTLKPYKAMVAVIDYHVGVDKLKGSINFYLRPGNGGKLGHLLSMMHTSESESNFRDEALTLLRNPDVQKKILADAQRYLLLNPSKSPLVEESEVKAPAAENSRGLRAIISDACQKLRW